MELEEKIKAIGELSVFDNLSYEHHKKIARRMGIKKFSAGSCLFQENESGGELFVITEGEVEVKIGNEIISTLSIGNMFGEMSAFAKAKRSASVTAKTDICVLFLRREAVQQLVIEIPLLGVKVIDILAHRLRVINKRYLQRTGAGETNKDFDFTHIENTDEHSTESKSDIAKSEGTICANCYEKNYHDKAYCQYCGEPLINKKRKNVVTFFAICLLFLTGYTTQNLPNKEKAPTQKQNDTALWVRTAKVRQEDFSLKVKGFGRVQAAKSLKLISQVKGKVTYVHPKLKRGGFVDKNEILIKIDSTDYDLAIERAKTQIKVAKAEIRNLISHRKNLKRQISVVQENVNLAKSVMENKKRLFQQKAVSEEQWTQARQSYLNLFSSLVDLETTYDSLPQRIVSTKSSLEDAELTFKNAQVEKARTTIKNHFNARVEEVFIEAGTVVSNQSQLAILEDRNTAEVKTFVQKEHLRRVFSSSSQMLNVVNQDEKIAVNITYQTGAQSFDWQGKITRLEPMDATTYSIPVIIQVENPWVITNGRPPLQSREFVHVTIQGRIRNNSIILPQAAIKANQQVYLVQNDKLIIRTVRVAEVVDNEVIVVEGVQPGDEVVLSEIDYPISGMDVKVFEESRLENSN